MANIIVIVLTIDFGQKLGQIYWIKKDYFSLVPEKETQETLG